MTDHQAHDTHVAASSDRAFGLVMAAFFAILAAWPLLDGGAVRTWPGVVAAGFAAVAAIRPATLAPLNRAWTRLGLLLGKVVAPVVMGLVFFVVVTPLGVLRRWTGSDPLRRKRDPNAASYWIDRTNAPPGTMKDQF